MMPTTQEPQESVLMHGEIASLTSIYHIPSNQDQKGQEQKKNKAHIKSQRGITWIL